MGVFTPGVWKDEYILGGSYKVVCGDQDIAYCYLGQKENARLIAAAPELYHMVAYLLGYVREWEARSSGSIYKAKVRSDIDKVESLLARIDGDNKNTEETATDVNFLHFRYFYL